MGRSFPGECLSPCPGTWGWWRATHSARREGGGGGRWMPNLPLPTWRSHYLVYLPTCTPQVPWEDIPACHLVTPTCMPCLTLANTHPVVDTLNWNLLQNRSIGGLGILLWCDLDRQDRPAWTLPCPCNSYYPHSSFPPRYPYLDIT